MLIVVVMKKFLAMSTIFIIAGVIVSGSGSVIAFNVADSTAAENCGVMLIGIENNASFLAPMPMAFSVIPLCTEKSPYGQVAMCCDPMACCFSAKI